MMEGEPSTELMGNGQKDEEQTTDIQPGMISDAKNFYRSKRDHHGGTTWVQEYPDDLEEPAENAETARYALLIYYEKCYDGRKKLMINSIVVQSPLLKHVLGSVLENYPGITTSLDRLIFFPGFEPFVHRWSNLMKALEDEKDTETKAHLDLFCQTLKAELEDKLKARDDFIRNGVITFDTCWMIFEPGSIVFNAGPNGAGAAKLKHGQYCGCVYALTCEMIDWDGENFGLASTHSSISSFDGTELITQLCAYPFEYHPSQSNVKDELVQRGKAFERLAGYHYKQYQGIAIGQGPWGLVKYNVDSRIIIDTYAWNRFNPNSQVSLSPLGTLVKETPMKDNITFEAFPGQYQEYAPDDYREYYPVQSSQVHPGKVSESNQKLEQMNNMLKGKETSKKAVPPLTSEQLLLCKSTLRGYSLKDKKWLTFAIESVDEIHWNEGAFESLVLPEDHKDLVLALSESQVVNKETFDDVIQGKGKGMIMLLSGPPGVGKTLTAESVAESMKAPLNMMSAGDLGLSSSEVESALSNVLEMCTKWNAILLLDEADVFLEQRSSHDLERNMLVSIFLRMLEYYEGILFLTTNRVGNIDTAFQSRIHISMEYKELSLSSRRHVWSNFLAASPKKHNFSEADLDKLAEFTMNGREIKNVLKTAQLLASRKGVGLGFEHVRSVLEIEKRHVRGTE